MTGVTISTSASELTMPPSTGVARGFITSAPVEWLHMIGGGEPPAVHVEPLHVRRGDEAPGHARARRHGQLARARPDRHARDLLLATGARTEAGRARGADGRSGGTHENGIGLDRLMTERRTLMK